MTMAGLRVAKTGSQSRRRPTSAGAVSDADGDGAAPPLGGGGLVVGVGPSGIDGIPADYDDGAEWLRSGLRRHRRGVITGLIVGWTGIWLALWGAAIGAVVGILFALGATDTPFGTKLFHIGAGQAVTALSVTAGIVLGAIGGFFEVLRFVLAETPYQVFVALASGAIVTLIVVLFGAVFERLGLRLRGYRRLSRDEVRRVAPLVRNVAEGMNLDGLPRFAMADVVIPNAWTHMRTVVITTGLLQTLDDAELRAVLAHELTALAVRRRGRASTSCGPRRGRSPHLQRRDARRRPATQPGGTALRSLPRAAGSDRLDHRVASVGHSHRRWSRSSRSTSAATSTRPTPRPADLGYAPSLITALRKMGAFESGRTGWERAMKATHPPTELRIEALQPPKPDDAQYQESELRAPSLAGGPAAPTGAVPPVDHRR